MSVKMFKQPPPAPTTSAVGSCPTIIQIVGRPGIGSLPRTIALPDHPTGSVPRAIAPTDHPRTGMKTPLDLLSLLRGMYLETEEFGLDQK